ncbi:hypothetical protein L211DRAFT_574733 [Terfezia boudieri ATCC MYA-4762]|uniref:Uncharacterized protein n=1 Tax=Terfezia boudieri ATCC MYA-4762 TaxID=1051890 RepID=A0A3N4LB82_9PEZI|nr:hypothetical protein L211DRAFT_574733 [Terfezia boudieri ATCC MYA-4762]
MIVDGKNYWEGVQHKDTIAQLLSDFAWIGEDISQGLVKESIERTHNILSIDEAFRSRALAFGLERVIAIASILSLLHLMLAQCGEDGFIFFFAMGNPSDYVCGAR